jgi:hypothetical protein
MIIKALLVTYRAVLRSTRARQEDRYHSAILRVVDG